MCFLILFLCRSLAALTHAVSDELSFNEVNTLVQTICTSVEPSLHLYKTDHIHPRIILYL